MNLLHTLRHPVRTTLTTLLTLVCFCSASLGWADTLYFVHTDHLGTPRVITDDSQQTVWEGSQAPFGEVATTTNTIEFNVRFPGQYYDQESGLHYNYFRDYDPSLGRYIQSDPIGLKGGINTYAYVSSNPIADYDPFGLNQMNRSPHAPGLRGQDMTCEQRAANLHKQLMATGIVLGLGLSLVEGVFLGGSALGLMVAASSGDIPAPVSRSAQLATNRAAGLAAEARAAEDLVSEGYTILGSQVSVRTSEGRRVIDHLVQDSSGTVLAIEVKSGNGVRNAAQLAKDNALATEGGVLVGKNAGELGGQSMVIQTVERRY